MAVLQELEAVMKQQGVQHPALESDISEQLLSDVLSQTQVALDRIKIEQPPQSATVAQPLAATATVAVSDEFVVMDDNFPVCANDPMMSLSSTTGDVPAPAATITLSDVTDMLL